MASNIAMYAMYGLIGYFVLKGIGFQFDSSKFSSAIGGFGRRLHQGFSSAEAPNAANVVRTQMSSFSYRR